MLGSPRFSRPSCRLRELLDPACRCPSQANRRLAGGRRQQVFRSKKRYGKANELNGSIPRDHWHVDVSYLNICGTFYFMCSFLDECIRVTAMWTIDDARKAVTDYVTHYNEVRLPSAIGYVTPHTKLAGEEKTVFADRDTKLEAAREQRRMRRAVARQSVA